MSTAGRQHHATLAAATYRQFLVNIYGHQVSDKPRPAPPPMPETIGPFVFASRVFLGHTAAISGAQAAMTTQPDNVPPSTVLIADDNPQIGELLEAYLEPLNVTVKWAADGDAAIAQVEQHQPDLILLDIMMPKKSGFEVCRLLKDDPRYRDIPIIMVTALNEAGDLERARECGGDDFLSKPVNKIELLARVSNLLKLRHLKRKLETDGSDAPTIH